MDARSLRMKKLDDAEATATKYESNQLYMHLSALSPSTRKEHASKHGRLFTQDDMRKWLESDENDAACKCSFIAVLIDNDGNPLVPSIVDQARATYKKMAAKGYEWSK